MAYKFRNLLYSFWGKNLIKFKNDFRCSCLTKKFTVSTFFAGATICKNSTLDSTVIDEHVTTSGDFSHRKLIQQACSSSANATSELLTQILLAVMDSASKYKKYLDLIMENLEDSDELLIYGSVNPMNEDDIIKARNQAKISKEEFWDLVTMSEHIEKLATAAAEVSFLIGAETLAMLISERLYSIQQKIKNEIEDVKKKESEYLKLQKTSIEERKNDCT